MSEPVPSDSPVTPDWMDDEEWERFCAVRAADAELESWADPEDDFEDGPEERPEEPAAGPAWGFGQGRCLDEAAPCTALSGLADDASGQDRAFVGVNDDQLLGVLSARKRLEARQAWELLVVVAEFIRRRPAPGCALEGPARMPRVWHEHAPAELRAELHLSPVKADELLGLAWDLTVKLPRTFAALRDGILDYGRARLIALRCQPLTPAEAAAAEALLFANPEVGEWTYGMVRDRIARAVIQVNSQAAVRRREHAAKARRIEVWAEDSGNAALVGRELPPAAVLAANQLLTARARQLRKAGLDGGMDELRVLAYLERLGVLDPLAGTTAPDGAPADHDADPGHGNDQDHGGHADDGNPGGADGDRSGPGNVPGGSTGGGTSGTGGSGLASAIPAIPPGGLAAHVNLTVPLATALHLADRPGQLSRIGPVDPALARDLTAAAARHPASTLCLTVTGDDGRPVAHGCGRPPPRAVPRPGAPGEDRPPPGGHGTIRISTTAFTGTATSGGEDLVFTIEPLAGPCDHRHQAEGHDPGRLLRHLTAILNGTCTFPPCRCPEHQTDYEHSQPFEQGGKTCLCDSGPVCRHDHRAKQAPGWRLEQAGARGWFRWTTPSGRSYLSRPTQYPA